ncbi:MFS transporter [Nocardioides rubriscoriae]|uniref:MFS transporter n=1 Tax=Nocardioides rubriscoriae TaxID=642762 RepID=UPI001FE2D118|nr:MFS transporter [Nocardioides rubriscoriae]
MAIGTQSAERSPEFRRFWWGEAVSGMGSGISNLALQTVVLVTLGGSAVEVGWLNSARLLPYLLLGLVVGALVDRVRRRPVLVATDLAQAALLGLVPLAWALGALSFPLLLVVVVLFGTASLVDAAASMSFVPRLVPRDRLQRAHARLDSADAVAQTAGPAMAGALIRVLGAPLAVVVDAATYVFSAVMMASLKDVAEPEPTKPDLPGVRGLAREIGEGARWVYGGSGLRRLAVSTHVWFAAQAVLTVVVVPYAYLRLDLSPVQVGLVFAVAGVGALVGAATSTRLGLRVGTGGAIISTRVASSVGVVVMMAATVVPVGWAAGAVLAAGQLCHGWAMGTSNSHEMAFRQAMTPDALQARTNTTMRSLNRGVVVVVSPLAGLLADRVGYGPALAVTAAVFAGSALLLIFSPLRHARID